MRSIHSNIQPNSQLHLIHHSQTLQHFKLIPSFPQHILHLLLPSEFRRNDNLRLFLVGAKLHIPSQNYIPPLLGSFKCSGHGSTCSYKTNGLTSYTFHSTGETRPITQHITCNSKNLIYMIQYKQYI